MSCGHGWSEADFDGWRELGFGIAALRYASFGYSVLPVVRGDKKPHRMLPMGGVHNATTDPQQIRQWWSLDPAANIGVATGSVSQLAVIDVDCKGEVDGTETYNQVLSDHMPIGLPLAITPGGGYHVWMRTPPGLLVPDRPAILPGIDLKGEGGYVVAPPSARFVVPLGLDGERVDPIPVPYSWIWGCPCMALAPWAPAWLQHWASTAPGGSGGTGGERSDPPDLEMLKRTGIPRGQRNHTVYRLACSLYRKYGTDPRGAARVLDEIRQVWSASDTRDFPWREVRVSVESARKFIAAAAEQDWRNMVTAHEWLRTLDRRA